MEQIPQRPANPRRRKKSQMQIFKETYLPLLIVSMAVLLILVFIVGALVRAVSNYNEREAQRKQNNKDRIAQQQMLEQEAQEISQKAALAAAGYDYDGAIAIIKGFSGQESDFPQLGQQRIGYLQQKNQLTVWDDPSKIPNYSIRMLIADPDRAFQDDKYLSSFTRNFLTTEEFRNILQALYDNGYVLVSMEDVFTTRQTADGQWIYEANTIYLPEGKTPFILTQTNVNYHTYLVDGSDEDRYPDGEGRGFASKLILLDGKPVNEYVDAQGTTHTGAYDMIPILEEFIAGHPDFSYRGARAIIAVTGYDGLFGYRTNSEAEQEFGAAIYEQELEGARTIARALTDLGYELACYTYEEKAYGGMSASEIRADLSGWTTEVINILPDVDIFVYAKNSDVGPENGYYNDTRLTILTDAGFSRFVGYATAGNPWAVITDSYIRQGQILLNPNTVTYHPDWFGNAFDAQEILDPNRGDIPA